MSFFGKNRCTRNILLSRLLTHSGDQAWDFAVPLALVTIFPASLDVVALYYLIVRCAHMLLVTRVCAMLDRSRRISAIRAGIGIQSLGVMLAAGGIFSMSGSATGAEPWSSVSMTMSFIGVVAAGLMGSLGATIMDVAVSQDWLPTLVPPDELTRANSRLKQIDLFTELAAPVLAGLLLSLQFSDLRLLGLYLIALWNLLSFLPEYFLLRQVYQSNAALISKAIVVPDQRRRGFLQNLTGGWRDFLNQAAALPMLAYALLWLTVLSPHGVLLAAWLKTQWAMSEVSIGVLRGLGAVFGLLATVLFPLVVKRYRLIAAARMFIVLEALCLVGVGVAFYLGAAFAWVFAAFLLLSRIGLYGFSLGETEIRQVMVAPAVRGRVNGFANALTSLATLGVYGAGVFLKDPRDFAVLVTGSVVFVALGALVFTFWSRYGLVNGEIMQPAES